MYILRHFFLYQIFPCWSQLHCWFIRFSMVVLFDFLFSLISSETTDMKKFLQQWNKTNIFFSFRTIMQRNRSLIDDLIAIWSYLARSKRSKQHFFAPTNFGNFCEYEEQCTKEIRDFAQFLYFWHFLSVYNIWIIAIVVY